jgi:hypothetical protein
VPANPTKLFFARTDDFLAGVSSIQMKAEKTSAQIQGGIKK